MIIRRSKIKIIKPDAEEFSLNLPIQENITEWFRVKFRFFIVDGFGHVAYGWDAHELEGICFENRIQIW